MKPIMLLIEELNSLWKTYNAPIDDSAQKQRIRQIFSEFVKQGYKIVRPGFDTASEEFKRLSNNGKLLCEMLILIQEKQREAIDKSQVEFAANLGDWEQDINRKITLDFSRAINNRIFVLKSDDLKEIVCNDCSGNLKEFLTLT